VSAFRAAALEAGDDDDVAGVEILGDFFRRDVEDLGLGVGAIGDDAGLGAGERDGAEAQPLESEGEERDGLLLAGGKKHVDLARSGLGIDLAGELDQAVGDAGHGGDDDDEPMPLAVGFRHTRGDMADALGRADGAAAIFLDDERHGKGVRIKSIS
jgi:hypothetical protein